GGLPGPTHRIGPHGTSRDYYADDAGAEHAQPGGAVTGRGGIPGQACSAQASSYRRHESSPGHTWFARAAEGGPGVPGVYSDLPFRHIPHRAVSVAAERAITAVRSVPGS